MKKTINKNIFLLILILSACSQKEQKPPTNTEAPEVVVTEIVGIGKVLPQDGIVFLSVDKANKVVKVNKKVGDFVKKGEVLFSMKSNDETSNIEIAEAKAQSAKIEIDAAQLDVQKALIKEKELKDQFLTTKQLFQKQAETREQYVKDSLALKEQKAILLQLQKKVAMQNALLNEKNIEVNARKKDAQELNYLALQSGQLIRFDVAVGGTLMPSSDFGELAPEGPLVIEGELDEFYANKIKEGQVVNIALIGQTTSVATGKITYVGSSLQNKSILYETVGEGQDRRVRRFTVTLDQGSENLIINQKVECKIKL